MTSIFKKFLNKISSGFSQKRVVVISDDLIKNITLHKSTQIFIFSLTLAACIFGSIAIDQYVSSSEIVWKKNNLINSKDKTIKSLDSLIKSKNDSLASKEEELSLSFEQQNNLKEEIKLLQGNLEQASKYIDSLGKYDHTKTSKKKDSTASKLDLKLSNNQLKDSNSLLTNLTKKILLRSEELESLLDETGLGLDNIAKSDKILKKFVANSSRNQGGEYIPVDGESNLVHELSYLSELEKAVHSLPLTSPIKNYRITSNFGLRTDPVRKFRANHQGLDMIGRYRAQIVTPAPGVVVKAQRNGAYGLYVEIKHKYNITTRYGHLSKIKVKKGQKVSRGDLIGLQGKTGRTTGEHLHYEIRHNKKPIDPKKFLVAGKNAF